jgi:hypothetical protein
MVLFLRVVWEHDDYIENYNYYDPRDLVVVPNDFVKLKVCTCCKEEKDIYEFKKSKNSEDGYFPMCDGCVESKKQTHENNYKRYFSK